MGPVELQRVKSCHHMHVKHRPSCLGNVGVYRSQEMNMILTHSYRCNLVEKRGNLMVAFGERRSANRAGWSSSDTQHTMHHDTDRLQVDDPIRPPVAEIDVWKCVDTLSDDFRDIDRLVSANMKRVQAAFRQSRIGPHHFQGSTGYGHGDLGRAALDNIVASIMGAEAAAARIQFVSGTHAIAAGLFSVLRPGDELLAVAGSPYDTLEEVIGTRGLENSGSLIDFGISYRELDLTPSGGVDYEELCHAVSPQTKVALVQRSCGYALRPTLTIRDIEKIVASVKKQNPDTYVIVDNCYGEFTDYVEPPAVGADLCMGSFIKNPGGTIAPGGGYIAGKEYLVERAVARMSAPGVGMDAGCVPGETLRLMYQGIDLV